MSFNSNKCYVMHIGTKENMYKHTYKMCDYVLETVETHQYLGIYFPTISSGIIILSAFLKTLIECLAYNRETCTEKTMSRTDKAVYLLWTCAVHPLL